MNHNIRIILASGSPRRRELLCQIGLAFEVRVSDVEEKATASDPGPVVEELSLQKARAVLEAAGDIPEDVLVIGADTVVALEGHILGKPTDPEDAARMLRSLSGRSHEVYTGVTLLYRPGAALSGEAGALERNASPGEAGALEGDASPGEAGALERDASSGEAGTLERGASPGEAAAPKEDVSPGEARAPEGDASSGGDREGREHAAAGESCAGSAGNQVRCKTFHERTKVTFYPLTEQEISDYVSSGECLDKAGAYGIQGIFARHVQGIEGDYNNVVGLPVGRLYQEAKEWLT